VTLSYIPFCIVSPKKKKKKRNINNNLAILPSHDIIPLLSFLVLRIFTTHNMGHSCYLFLSHLLLSILVRNIRSRNRVTQSRAELLQSRAELLWSKRELTTKIGNNLGLSLYTVSQSSVACVVAYFRRTELLSEVQERSGID